MHSTDSLVSSILPVTGCWEGPCGHFRLCSLIYFFFVQSLQVRSVMLYRQKSHDLVCPYHHSLISCPFIRRNVTCWTADIVYWAINEYIYIVGQGRSLGSPVDIAASVRCRWSRVWDFQGQEIFVVPKTSRTAVVSTRFLGLCSPLALRRGWEWVELCLCFSYSP